MRLLSLVVLLAACRHDADPPPDDTDVVDTDVVDTEVVDTDGCPGASALRLGTGDLDFVPIAPGDDVTMTHGPQGGWHVNVSFQADAVPQLVMLEWSLRITATGAVISTEDPFRKRVALVPRDQGAWDCLGDYPGERAYLAPENLEGYPDVPIWESLCGVPVTLEGTLRGPGQGSVLGPVLATDRVDFVLQPDPIDAPACHTLRATAP